MPTQADQVLMKCKVREIFSDTVVVIEGRRDKGGSKKAFKGGGNPPVSSSSIATGLEAFSDFKNIKVYWPMSYILHLDGIMP